jgi:hypothetical protein
MAQILTDAYISVNGTAWSSYANKVTITQDIDDVDVTTFGPGSFKSFAQGMQDASIQVSVFQSFSGGTASFDSMVSGLFYSRAAGSVEVRPTSSARGTSNPSYVMPVALLYNYSPLDSGVGDASAIDINFRNGGTSGIIRSTA